MPSTSRSFLSRGLPLAGLILLAGCTISKPRTDDPYEKLNRRVYAFNNSMDKHIMRPVAVGYRKITPQPIRNSVDNFFTNIHLPITIANDLLQGRPKAAGIASGRMVINVVWGFGGLLDPAGRSGIPLDETDFGITLARWGVPEGNFLMLPLLGPSTMRDAWKYPVDGYLFDPLSYYERIHSYTYAEEYLPEVLYFVSQRASFLDAENFLNSAFDRYAFMRDLYRQNRLYKIYLGNPPQSALDIMQGVKDHNFDPDELLDEQRQWEQKQKQSSGQPAPPPSPAAPEN